MLLGPHSTPRHVAKGSQTDSSATEKNKSSLPEVVSVRHLFLSQNGGVAVPHCSPANDHSQDDGKPPVLQDLQAGWALPGNDDPQRGESQEANADQRHQVPRL